MLHTVCSGRGHLYDDSSAPSLHGKNREIGAEEVNIEVSMPFIIITNDFLYVKIPPMYLLYLVV